MGMLAFDGEKAGKLGGRFGC